MTACHDNDTTGSTTNRQRWGQEGGIGFGHWVFGGFLSCKTGHEGHFVTYCISVRISCTENVGRACHVCRFVHLSIWASDKGQGTRDRVPSSRVLTCWYVVSCPPFLRFGDPPPLPPPPFQNDVMTIFPWRVRQGRKPSQVQPSTCGSLSLSLLGRSGLLTETQTQAQTQTFSRFRKERGNVAETRHLCARFVNGGPKVVFVDQGHNQEHGRPGTGSGSASTNPF